MPMLRDLRQRAYLHQREVAERVGVSATTVANWETGRKHPRLAHQRKLAEVLGVPPSEIDYPQDAERQK